MDRVNGLNRVRALAALSVALAHIMPLPGPLKYVFTGHPAVIVFFVVSGFCITYPHRDSRPQILSFLAARYIRIGVPLAVCLAAAHALSSRYPGLAYYNMTDGYIVWSVVCELIYYSLFPVFYWLAARTSWWFLVAVSVVISYAIVLGLGSDQYGNAHIYGPSLNWLVSLPAWLLGCALATGSIARVPGNVWAWRLATATAASTCYALTLNTIIGFYLTMVPFSFLAFLWIKAEISEKTATPTLDSVGEWSYSLYLVHAFALVALAGLAPKSVIVIAALLLSYTFFIIVERPSHRLARFVRARLLHGKPSSFFARQQFSDAKE